MSRRHDNTSIKTSGNRCSCLLSQSTRLICSALFDTNGLNGGKR